MINRTIENWYTSDKVTEVTTIIGNTGYGKTYLGLKIGEIYCDNKWPFVVIDKMGIWFTIRSAYDNVVIIGGKYADIALDDIDSYLEKILEKDISFILDLSEIDELDAQELVKGFFDYVFDWHKKTRKPRNYMIEECDSFIGQTGANTKTKQAITKCITKGRMNGFGFTLLSQRFRMIDKTPLGQTRNYVVFNMKLTNDLSTLKSLVGEDISAKVRRLKEGKCIIMTDEGHEGYAVGLKKSKNSASTPQIGKPLEEIEILELAEDIKTELEMHDNE